MTSNALRLISEKTESILLGQPGKRNKCELNNISVADAIIPTATTVKDLAVIIDQELSMADHVNYIAKICFFHLSNIGRVRPLLNKEAAVTLCRGLVSSRIDYCNSLLAGLPESATAGVFQTFVVT